VGFDLSGVQEVELLQNKSKVRLESDLCRVSA
jgi:hypothetical protein